MSGFAGDVRYGSAIAAVTLGVQLDRAPKITAVEIRPQSIKKHQLRVSALPEQEVGCPLFPRRADEEVNVWDLGLVEEVPKSLLGELARIKPALRRQLCDAPSRVHDLGAASVVDAKLQGQHVIVNGAALGVLQLGDHASPKPRRSAGPAHSHSHCIQLVATPPDHIAVEAHEPANLIG